MKLRSGTPDEVGVSPERVDGLRKLAQGWVDSGIHPSLVVLAARRGVIFLHEAYGRLGPEDDSPPLRLDAIYPIASISKPITVTAVMIMVEEGLLGLNRPVKEYIPELKGEGTGQVLIRHLMTHTSGITDEELAERARGQGVELGPTPTDLAIDFATWAIDNPGEYWPLLFEAPLKTPPDTEMVYADANYNLLGEVVGRVSGRGLAGFAEGRIFEPLGMLDTTFDALDPEGERIVKRSETAILSDLIKGFAKASFGSSGACSTVGDMATFGQMFLNGGTYGDARILSQAAVRAMITNQIPGLGARFGDEIFPDASWGLGWSVHSNKKAWSWDELLLSESAFVHSGAGGVIMWIDPTCDLIAVFFSVYLDFLEDGRPNSSSDLFINAALASIVEL